MTTSIEQLWRTLADGPVAPAQMRVAADHPLDLFAQLDSRRRVGLLAISDMMPERPPPYAAVDIVVGKRADGRWATSLSLIQPGLLPMFATMCSQMVEQGRDLPPGACAGSFMLVQVARWHRLLALGSDGLLSAEEQRGLFGELEILRMAADRHGPMVASAGWTGPEDAPQDFDLPDGAVEVKTIQSGAPVILISSLNQLDVEQGRLAVAVVDLVHCAAGTGGTSLAGAVNAVRDRFATSPLALQQFEARLQKAGYVEREEYAVIEYRVARIRWFMVSGAFPRLVRSHVPPAIASARYQLLLSELDPFETNPFADHGRT